MAINFFDDESARKIGEAVERESTRDPNVRRYRPPAGDSYDQPLPPTQIVEVMGRAPQIIPNSNPPTGAYAGQIMYATATPGAPTLSALSPCWIVPLNQEALYGGRFYLAIRTGNAADGKPIFLTCFTPFLLAQIYARQGLGLNGVVYDAIGFAPIPGTTGFDTGFPCWAWQIFEGLLPPNNLTYPPLTVGVNYPVIGQNGQLTFNGLTRPLLIVIGGWVIGVSCLQNGGVGGNTY